MMKKRHILLLVIMIPLILILLFVLIDERKWSIMFNSNTNNEKSIQQSTKETEQSRDIKSKKTTESRTVEIHLNTEFIVDRDKNSYKTNEKGTIKGNILYKHSTLTEEQIAVYAFLQNDNTPLKIEINGTVNSHHIIDVPKEGTKKIPFTISSLPPGEHFIYIISEKVLNDKISDPLEIYKTQKTVAGNYLSLEVINKGKEVSSIQNKFTPAQKIQDLENETTLVMQMYEDSNLTKEVESISKDNYFLTIENKHDFELKAQLKLISEYIPVELQQVLIPPKSKVMVPIEIKNINLNKSARIIMVGEPLENLDIPLPLRIVKITNRFPIVN
ncbi:hypothetical protein PGC35_19595 [Psychrobacillus sp. PGGUH221]|uniref:hypothetical protein n=1 Tax=Psychrobacillus sp. PGGUH221 TaxID=3020058 RepID=UPI0035C70544